MTSHRKRSIQLAEFWCSLHSERSQVFTYEALKFHAFPLTYLREAKRPRYVTREFSVTIYWKMNLHEGAALLARGDIFRLTECKVKIEYLCIFSTITVLAK
jgi:hypothetical protein